MSNAISELQAQFIYFAKGMPAIAISWDQISRDVNLVLDGLAGINPGSPSKYTGNIDMPVYGLAYSSFVANLSLTAGAGAAVLEVTINVNIHPKGHPEAVIRSYLIESSSPVAIEFDEGVNELYWRSQGGVAPIITPSWGADADSALMHTQVPPPQKDTYLQEVERQIIWLTGPSFIRLVVDLLPRYNLTEIVPWLRFKPSIRVDFGSSHVVITSLRASIAVGDCSQSTIVITPDPDFPYGKPVPNPTLSSDHIDMAVYSPKTKLVEYVSKKIEPAIMVADSGGGSIKWRVAGSFGLKSILVELSTGQGLSGVLSVKSVIDFVGAARAWVDGPCGTKIAEVGASVIGQGELGADIKVDLDINTGMISAFLVVTHSDLPYVDWDVNTPLPWPINEVAALIFESISVDEVRKLSRSITKLGRWEMFGLSDKYFKSLKQYEAAVAVSEGLSGVSAFIGVTRRNSGKRPHP